MPDMVYLAECVYMCVVKVCSAGIFKNLVMGGGIGGGGKIKVWGTGVLW